MPLFDQSQLAAQEVQKILQAAWFHPQTLHKYLDALKVWQPDQVAATIDGQAVYLNRIFYDLKQFFQGLPLSTRQTLAKYGLTVSSFEKFPLPPEVLTVLDQTLVEIAGLTPQTPASNIPQNLKELVAEAQLIAEARTAAASAQKLNIFFDLKSQIDRAVKINQQVQILRTNTTGRLFHLLQDSSYINNLQIIYGRDVVNKILWDRLDAVAEQAITTLTVNQAGLLNQDPARAAAYFTKQLEEIIKNDDLLPTALAKTQKSAKKEVLQDIQKQTEQVAQELKPVAAEFQAEQVKAPTNQESALKIAAEKIALPEKQRQVFFRELQKHPGNQPAIIARVFPNTSLAERDQLHEQISPLLSAPRYPTLAELQNQNSLVTLVRTHPQLFPHAVVSQIISGQLSTPEESALLQIAANRLGIPLDVATLYRAGLNPVTLIINHFHRLASGKKVLGLFPVQPKAAKTHPVIAEIDRRLEQFSKIDSVLQDVPPALPPSPFRKFKSLSHQTSQQTKWEQRFDSFRLDQSLRYGINNIRSFQSTGRNISSFFSALRVRSAPANFIFNTFESVGGGFRSLPSIISSPFRAAGNFVNTQIFTPIKSWIGNQARAGLAKAGAWVAKTGIGQAAKALAIKLGSSLLAKGTAALLAQAAPVVGQIAGIIAALSMAKDLAKLAWDNREAIAKIGLGLLSGGLILFSKLLGALGTAAWGLAGGLLGGAAGFILSGGNPLIAAAGATAGATLFSWIGSGGLSSALSAAGAWLGTTAAGVGNFIAGLSVPISSSVITTVTIWSVLGSLSTVIGVAIIKDIQQNSALMAPAEGDVQINCENAPHEKPEVAPGDILFSNDRRYAFPVAPFSKIYYGCIHHDYPATDIGIYGDAAHDPPLGAHLPVIAFTSGTISWISESDTLGGKSFIIQADPDSSGKVYYYYYAHNCTQYISQGQHVNAGDVIATTNNTGNAAHTIEHLHFQICTLENCVTIPDNYSFFKCPGPVFKEKFGINNCTPAELANCVPAQTEP